MVKYKIDLACGKDFRAETLWHNEKIISTVIMQDDKLKCFEFNAENI